VKCLCGAIYGDTPDYQKFRANGGHPYWSLLPPPANTDSLAVRAGGKPEPVTDFVPPSDWLIQCPCGARNEDHGTCWHCGGSLGGGVSLPAPSMNYMPRTAECPGCNRLVREIEFGKFELGVRCPFCATIMQIVPVQPDPTARPRTMECDHCRRIIREPYYGAFETGVTCPCGRIMFAAPQAV
jgi:phage FluMu protein Com